MSNKEENKNNCKECTYRSECIKQYSIKGVCDEYRFGGKYNPLNNLDAMRINRDVKEVVHFQ